MHPSPKLTRLEGSNWVRQQYAGVWQREKTSGPERLSIAPAGNHVDVLCSLLQCLPEPFGILYVLLLSRTGRELGRYQCPEPFSREDTISFLKSFREYLEGDGRHHIWIISLPTNATLVYDNHDLLYAYGSIAEYERILETTGLSSGTVVIPAPHGHQYNVEFDEDEERIMSFCPWLHFPLHPSDDP